MKRAHVLCLLVLIVVVPAATAASYFAPVTQIWSTNTLQPCFIAGNAGYRLSSTGAADYTVRIDNSTPTPNLRMQIVDDPAAADFVLVDDGDTAGACDGTATISSVRIDPDASRPDVTVALSRAAADYKIYVQSAKFSEQDGAALFAAIWQSARKTASAGRRFAERH
jgi:hypothetical protein